MKQFWFLTIFTILLAFVLNVCAEEEVVDKQLDTSALVAEPSTLIDLDADVKDDGDGVRETRQFGFGFGRPFYGGGFYRPRPFYGGGFYGPRPFYGGGFYRPRPFYGGGFYRPRPFYGGFYGPRPFFGGGFYG